MEENRISEEPIEEVVLVEETEPIEPMEEETLLEEEVSAEEAEEEAPKKKFSWFWPIVIGAIVVVTALTVLIAILGSKVNYKDYVKLGQYAGLTLTSEDMAAIDKATDEEIDGILSQKITYKEVDRAAQKGDVVNIDYAGRYAADGSEFAGGTDSGKDLELGSGSFIDGFEEGLVGVSAGETVELPLTFPEDYSNTLMAGVEVIFTVTVNKVTEPVKPVLDDAFVKENSDVETVEEYRQMVSDKLTADMLWNRVVENAEIVGYPEKDLANQIEDVHAGLASMYNMTYEDFVKTYTSYTGITAEAFEEMVTEQAKRELEYKMITYIIANEEGITWTQEEYDEQVNNILVGNGSLTVESFEAAYNVDFEKTYKNRIIDNILHNKVTDLILSTAVTE